MSHTEERLISLLNKEQWTPEERKWLLDYIEDTEHTELKELLRQKFDADAQHLKMHDAADVLQLIHKKIGRGNRKNGITIRLIQWAAVACFTGLVSWMGYRLLDQKEAIAVVTPPLATADQLIQPAGNKAVLTLGDGSTMVLDDTQNGLISQQGNTRISKPANGTIIYNQQGIKKDSIVFNTLTTPRGGQYQLTLPDGSRAWLNTASSIRFPNAFAGKNREVFISGEVYFEVAHNAAQPFMVHTGETSIQVLGTSFNVNSYDHTTGIVKTTLLKGSVQVNTTTTATKILPGEQAIVDGSQRATVNKAADLEQVMAWKNGQFYFEGASIEEVMTELSRWYDVDVVYEGEKPAATFYADIARNTALTDLLKALEQTNKINFEIKGGKIYVKN